MRNINIKNLLIITILLLVSFVSFAQVPTLHVEGKWIKDAAGNSVVLRGFALTDIDAIYKGSRLNYSTTPATTMYINDILNLANGWDYSVVRLTIHPSVNDETGNNGWLNYTPDFFYTNILDPAVQACISRNKYAIIDWHYVGVSWTDSTVVSNTNTFWNYIAPKYANNPNVIFELFNEPGSGTWSSWKSSAQVWIDLIRNTHGANNLIIVGGPNWSQTLPSSSGDLFTSSNIVYACHIYPGHVSGSVPSWIEYTSGVAPVMMTEWGYENNSTAGNPVVGTASSYGNIYKSYINSKSNVGWIAWCFDDAYRSIMFSRTWVLLGNGLVTNPADFFHYTDHPDGITPATDNNENYMGLFAKTWMTEQKNVYAPIIGATTEPGITTAPTDVPATPAPTDAPVDTPAPTDVPTATPAPTVTPGPTSVPTATPVGVTVAPTDVPSVTDVPAVTDVPTTPPTVTADPTSPPATGCTCTNLCTSQTSITVPFTKDGSGEFCYVASSLGTYVNSWNTDAVNINGTACTNTYVSSSSIAAISGVYYIYYKGSYSWSHIEIK